MSESFLNGKVTLHCGDCLDVLPTLAENSIDSCVTDPPYHLTSIVKRFGNENAKPALSAAQRRFAKTGGADRMPGTDQFGRLSTGFMGKQWDGGDIAFRPELWREVYRVLKPGAHLIAFGGTRTQHRMVCAIEDAGFEVRDTCAFLYGSGFPKNHSVGKNLDAKEERCACPQDLRSVRQDLETENAIPSSSQHDLQRGMCGSGNLAGEDWANQEAANIVQPLRQPDKRSAADKAAKTDSGLLQPIMQGESQREPSDTILREYEGKGAEGQKIWGKQPGLEGRGNISQSPRQLRQREIRSMPAVSEINGANGRLCDGASSSHGRMDRSSINAGGVCSPSGSPAIEQSAHESGIVALQSQPQISGAWPTCGRCGKPIVQDGLGTALKPGMELLCLARKPLSEKTVAPNVLKWGTGAINVDGCRVGTELIEGTRGAGRQHGKYSPIGAGSYSHIGRWPANVIHDGSEEVVGAFPETQSNGGGTSSTGFWQYDGRRQPIADGDSGSAARFFYSSKADSDDRLGSRHPTIKPVDLIQYLVRLVTPKGGTVIDPFAGTGTTGEAAWREGMKAVLIEREPEYQADIRRRMALCLSGPDERGRQTAKAKLKDKPVDHGPLFGGSDRTGRNPIGTLPPGREIGPTGLRDD